MRPSAATILTVCAAALAWLSSPKAALAQTADFRPRLDSLVRIMESHQRLMGALSIRRGNRVLYQRTFGFRDSASNGWVPTDTRTMFRVGSIAKPFTAVLIYQLIDERRLSLDTRLAEFFPQLPNSAVITVRDLLGHTSGLGEFTQGLDPYQPISRDSIVGRIAALPVQFAPGTARRYNNGGFVLLGYIVERLTGVSYDTALKRRIVDRIGLKRTRVGGPVNPAANEARSYYYGEGHWELQRDDVIENSGGAGSLVTTSEDLTRFLAALFAGKLISRASLTEMISGFDSGTIKSGKGLSPFTITGQTKSAYAHNGSIGAYTALIGYVSDDSLSLALTVNGHNYPLSQFFFNVWDILYGSAEPLPTFTEQALPEILAPALVGTYTAEGYGLTITIRRTAVGIEAQAAGQDPFALTYIGRNRFVVERDGILLQFAAPVSGFAPRFTLYQQKQEIPVVRVATP